MEDISFGMVIPNVLGGVQMPRNNADLTKLRELWGREALGFGCDADISHNVSTPAVVVFQCKEKLQLSKCTRIC